MSAVDVLAVMDMLYSRAFLTKEHAAQYREARAAVVELIEVLREARAKWIPHPQGPVTKRLNPLKTEFIARVDAALARVGGAP